MALSTVYSQDGKSVEQPSQPENRQRFRLTMDKILEPTSIVGCSISLMFCLGAVVVLSCFREKRKPLLIKQQLSLSLVLIDIVILGGFQGLKNKEACRTVTTILHYGVLACFAWLSADQYYNFKSVVKNEPTCSFMRLCVLSWGFPFPFLLIHILLGFLSGGRLGSKVYLCWDTDYIIFTVSIPAVLLMIASFVMLTRTIQTLLSPDLRASFSNPKELQGIKYTVKTSSVMILLSTIIWTFGFLLFWYPDNVNYQLVFALGHGLQGLFNFFFHCVFALEQNMYIATNNDVEEGDINDYTENGRRSTKMTDLLPEVEETAHVRKPIKKMSRIQLKREPEIPSMVEEETVKSTGSVITNNTEIIMENASVKAIKEKVPGTNIKNNHMNNTKTKKGRDDHQDLKKKNEAKQKQMEHIGPLEDLEIADGKSLSPNVKKKENAEKTTASSSGVFLETMKTPDYQRKSTDSNTIGKSHMSSVTKSVKGGDTKATVATKDAVTKTENQVPSSSDLRGSAKIEAMRRRESANSMTSHASPCSRRTSHTSGSGPFGMNELESLFNNPDLMKQGQERRRSSSTSNATVKTAHSESRFHADKSAS